MFTSPFKATHTRKKTKYNKKGSTVYASVEADIENGFLLRIRYKEGRGKKAEVIEKYLPVSTERFNRCYEEISV